MLVRNPGAIEARLNLDAPLLHEEKPEAALALLAVTPPPDANAAPALGTEQRALALIQLATHPRRAWCWGVGEPQGGPTLDAAVAAGPARPGGTQ